MLDEERTGIRGNTYVTTYISMRNMLIAQLEHDSAAYETGHFDRIGMHFDSAAESFDTVSRVVPRGSPESIRLNTAMAFWSAWIGARYNDWRNSYEIGQADWPRLARSLAADLVADRDASDPTIQRHFDVSRHRHE